MTGDVVNLNKARKAKAKAEADAKAKTNRAKFGLGKPQKTLAETVAAKMRRALDQHRLDRDTPKKD